MIILIVFGAYIAGFWGLVLAGPLVATLVQIVSYVREYYEKQNLPEAAEAEEPAA